MGKQLKQFLYAREFCPVPLITIYQKNNDILLDFHEKDGIEDGFKIIDETIKNMGNYGIV
ncbi:hypothetical protein [Oxobacter pfennigii]|uniref:hypothetical protein n=1 Tax=Oxobacter pfennigii TaxID=36849 RepID=UPI0006D416DF|nr:hypothetical protein [Oxobacter pfennigii]